jgi:hypothetical protein
MVAEASASVIDAGFGRIVGSRGDTPCETVLLMLGRWTLVGDAGLYEAALFGGELGLDRLLRPSCSWIGDGIEAIMMGERPPVDDPDDTDVVRLRLLLPWLNW